MSTRPRIAADLVPIRRAPDVVQLGLHPDGIAIGGLTDSDIRLLDAVDGTHTVAQLEALATRLGSDHSRVHELLSLLAAYDALDGPSRDRAAWWWRGRRHLVVGGGGPLADAIAAALRRERFGRVCLGDWALDHHDPIRVTTPGPCDRPVDLAVLVGRPDFDPDRSEPWLRHGIPHLSVRSHGTRASIGPIVAPRVAPDQPCGRCLELHHCDHDRAGSLVLDQLRTRLSPGPTRVDLRSVPFLASVTAAVITAYLDGQGLPGGVSVEVATPWPKVDYRRWSRHPRCPSHPASDPDSAAPAAAATTAPTQDSVRPGSRGTMAG